MLRFSLKDVLAAVERCAAPRGDTSAVPALA